MVTESLNILPKYLLEVMTPEALRIHLRTLKRQLEDDFDATTSQRLLEQIQVVEEQIDINEAIRALLKLPNIYK